MPRIQTLIVARPGPPGPNDHTLLANIGANSHAAIDTHVASRANPHVVTKAQVGLGNVDNTSDAAKPISTATQTALNGKAATTHSHAIADVTNLQVSLDAKQSASSEVARRLAADVTTTVTTNTYATGLDVPVGANETWAFDFYISTACSSTGGLKTAVRIPSGTMMAHSIGMGSTSAAFRSSQLTVSEGQSNPQNEVASAVGWGIVRGSVVVGATAGSISLGIASVTAGQTSTVSAGSHVTARRIS